MLMLVGWWRYALDFLSLSRPCLYLMKISNTFPAPDNWHRVWFKAVVIGQKSPCSNHNDEPQSEDASMASVWRCRHHNVGRLISWVTNRISQECQWSWNMKRNISRLTIWWNNSYLLFNYGTESGGILNRYYLQRIVNWPPIRRLWELVYWSGMRSVGVRWLEDWWWIKSL